MVKYLDLGGLTTVVNNVKSLVDVLHITSVEDTCNTSYINNTTTSGAYRLVYVKDQKVILAKVGSYYYTKWPARASYKAYTAYGTSTDTGVTPKNSTLIYCTSEKCLYFYYDNLNAVNSSAVWTTVWDTSSSNTSASTTPFIDTNGYVTQIDKRLNDNGNYVWRLTIHNADSKYGHEYRLSCGGGEVVSFLIYLQAGKSGVCTVELPKNQGNWYFSVIAK